MRLLLATLAVATLAGCGPVRSTAATMDAAAAVEAARAAGAAQSAPYELTAAEAYLRKAREVEGHARYETAERLATRARELADEARKNALAASGKGKQEER